MPLSASPIFIVGANRSGTTLLRLILNAHSRIAIPEELTYFQNNLFGTPIERWRRPEMVPEQYARLVKYYLARRCESIMQDLDFDKVRKEILDGPHDFKRPYQVVLEHWTRRQGKQRWGEKTPGNLFYADVICEMFPEAKFIHLVRDPRAGVSSMLKVSFFPDDVVFNALDRHKHMTTGRALLERNVPPDQRITIRYEDLVTAPEETVRHLCGFLDEGYEPEMLRFYEDADRYMKPRAASDFNAAATGPISSDKASTWRRRLTAGDVAAIEHISAPEMQEFGYRPEGHPLSLRNRLAILIKTAYWNYECWRHRHIRHYTVQHPMFASSRKRLKNACKALSRRLPLFEASGL